VASAAVLMGAADAEFHNRHLYGTSPYKLELTYQAVTEWRAAKRQGSRGLCAMTKP